MSSSPVTKSEPSVIDIERRGNVPYEEFVRDYLYPHKPIIFTDATTQWPALKTWTPAFFREKFADRVVKLDNVDHRVGDLMDRVLDPAPTAPVPYMRNQSLHDVFPELAKDIEPIPVYFTPNWIHGHYVPGKLDAIMNGLTALEIFIGGKGSAFPKLHIDSARTHAFLSQLYGEKEFVLFGPDQTKFLYSDEKSISAVRDVENPNQDNYPLFRHAVPTKFVMGPGETLFIPGGWWHTARMQSPSITLAVNTANGSNWSAMVKDIVRNQNGAAKIAISTYLMAIGRAKARETKMELQSA